MSNNNNTISASEMGLGAPSIKSAIEALILLQDDGITAMEIAQHTATSTDEIEILLNELKNEYLTDLRGFELREINGRWRFYSASNCS